MKRFVTGIRTLSILPIPGSDTEDHAGAVPFFPIVGLVLGLVVYGFAVCAEWLVGEWHQLTALCVVIAGAVVTRCIHLDGLADWADGFWGADDRERTLAIMKDTAVGTFGTVALLLVLLAKWVALVALLKVGAPVWIVTAYVVSRAMQSDLASSLPYARAEGGTALQFVDNSTRKHGLSAIILSLVTVFILQGVTGIYALVAAWAVASIFGLWCSRRVQGVTGDLLGACSELVETSVLMFGAVLTLGT